MASHFATVSKHRGFSTICLSDHLGQALTAEEPAIIGARIDSGSNGSCNGNS